MKTEVIDWGYFTMIVPPTTTTTTTSSSSKTTTTTSLKEKEEGEEEERGSRVPVVGFYYSEDARRSFVKSGEMASSPPAQLPAK